MLQAGKLLLTVAIGVEVTAVLCIAVTQTGGRKALAVVIDDH